jgi:hypothetical protein
MDTIFRIVYNILVWISNVTGLTYKEINIIVYFMVIPMVYLHLIDRIVKRNYLKIGFLLLLAVFFIVVKSFEAFSVRLFDASVRFLLWFKAIGWNYTEASVIVCVVIPFIVLLILLFVLFRKRILLLIDRIYD